MMPMYGMPDRWGQPHGSGTASMDHQVPTHPTHSGWRWTSGLCNTDCHAKAKVCKTCGARRALAEQQCDNDQCCGSIPMPQAPQRESEPTRGCSTRWPTSWRPLRLRQTMAVPDTPSIQRWPNNNANCSSKRSTRDTDRTATSWTYLSIRGSSFKSDMKKNLIASRPPGARLDSCTEALERSRTRLKQACEAYDLARRTVKAARAGRGNSA